MKGGFPGLSVRVKRPNVHYAFAFCPGLLNEVETHDLAGRVVGMASPERGASRMGGGEKKSGSSFRGVGAAAALSAQLILSIMVGFLVGRWMDGVFHTAPWLTVIGVLLGIVAGFIGLFHLSRVFFK